MLEVVLLMQAILLLFPCLHKEKEEWFLRLASMRWNASTYESSLWPQKNMGKAKARFFCQFVVIKFMSCTAPKLLWLWGSHRVVFFCFSWENRFEIQGDHLLIHCSLTTQAVQHQNPRILCLTGGSCDVWYKHKESKPSYPARKSGEPLSLA